MKAAIINLLATVSFFGIFIGWYFQPAIGVLCIAYFYCYCHWWAEERERKNAEKHAQRRVNPDWEPDCEDKS